MNNPSEPLFIESLKIVNGQFIHPELHLYRMKQTSLDAYGTHLTFHLSDSLIPIDKRQGIIKCRILYGAKIMEIEFVSYHPRQIHTLKLIEANHINYHLKYADRTALLHLLSQRGKCDDILIVRNGEITDTSYSNIVFDNGNELITPTSYLLNGTKRQFLLQRGIIRETKITITDLSQFNSLLLVNAMLSPEDNIRIKISDIQK